MHKLILALAAIVVLMIVAGSVAFAYTSQQSTQNRVCAILSEAPDGVSGYWLLTWDEQVAGVHYVTTPGLTPLDVHAEAQLTKWPDFFQGTSDGIIVPGDTNITLACFADHLKWHFFEVTDDYGNAIPNINDEVYLIPSTTA